MFGLLPDTPQQTAAFEQVQAWVRERFSLPADSAVLVTEVVCALPGCPPLETVIAFWTETAALKPLRHHYKVFKPVQHVVQDDLPPYWMKNALAVPPDWACDCC
jgi:hypothetical protein